MTVLPWPADLFSPRTRPIRSRIVEALPQSVLHQLVADLPGPSRETETERAARFKAQLAQVLDYKPRDSADAMIAVQCIAMGLLAEECQRGATLSRQDPAKAKKFLREAKQFGELITELERTLRSRQAEAAVKLDPDMFVSLGLEEFLVPDPDHDVEEAYSAIIVPLHPAPSLLQ